MLRTVVRIGIVLGVAKLVEENLRVKREAVTHAIVAKLAQTRAENAEKRAAATDKAERERDQALARVAQLEVACINLRRTVDVLLAGRAMSDAAAKARSDADEIIGQK